MDIYQQAVVQLSDLISPAGRKITLKTTCLSCGKVSRLVETARNDRIFDPTTRKVDKVRLRCTKCNATQFTALIDVAPRLRPHNIVIQTQKKEVSK